MRKRQEREGDQEKRMITDVKIFICVQETRKEK